MWCVVASVWYQSRATGLSEGEEDGGWGVGADEGLLEVGARDGESVGVVEGGAGLGLCVGLLDVGAREGDVEGAAEGRLDVGAREGLALGRRDGLALGRSEGLALGARVVGVLVGEDVGVVVGADVGAPVGTDVGDADATGASVITCVVCVAVGAADGESVYGLGHSPPASSSGWPFFLTHWPPTHWQRAEYALHPGSHVNAHVSLHIHPRSEVVPHGEDDKKTKSRLKLLRHADLRTEHASEVSVGPGTHEDSSTLAADAP